MKKRTRKIIWISVLALCLYLLISLMFTKPQNPDLQIFSLQEWFRFPSPVRIGDMSHKMRVAAVALPAESVKERCLANIESIAAEIKSNEPDTRLILFGESSLGLYFDKEKKRAYQEQAAETIPGAATGRLGNLARNLNIYLAAGLIEISSDTLFNSLVVLDPDGNLVARHRKQYLHEYDVLNGIEAGNDQATLCDIDGFRAGLSICADANKKTLIKACKNNRIDILLNSVASDIPWLLKGTRYWPLATKYDSWIISANRYGQEGEEHYSGYIFIADKRGAMHKKRSGSSGYITSVIGK